MRKLKMTKYISNGQLNVEYLTKAQKRNLAEHYSDKPKLYSLLTGSSLSFEVEEERGKVIFLVANEVQKL